jgi:mono/diheme cytochrome c family protein
MDLASVSWEHVFDSGFNFSNRYLRDPMNTFLKSGNARMHLTGPRLGFANAASLLFFVSLAWPSSIAQAQNEISSRDLKAIESFQRFTKVATEQIEAKKLRPALSAVKSGLSQLKRLTKKPNPTAIEKISATYGEFKTAYEQLVAAGAKLPKLIELPGVAATSSVSFTKDVAPILVAKCGNCHVNRQQGNFSLATFNAINVGGGVIGGQPANSRLVEVIESGEMPQGGATVSKQELDVLKNWIAGGAKFDGDNARQSLTDFAPARTRANTDSMVKAPTGKETVSFAEDVAPILVQNCQRCHMVTNPRGGFSMANFRALLRGGDGGAAINPGDPEASQFIKRLRGDGVNVMPPGRKLSEDKIQTIVTWIKEDATFDGDGVNTATPIVAANARANAMPHEEFVKFREAQTEKTWKLAMGDLESKTISTDNFFVAGDADEAKLNQVAAAAEKIAKRVSEKGGLESTGPFIRGNATIYVFQKRYDFGEFGRMVEKREYPRTVSSGWRRSPEDAYLTVLMTRNKQLADIELDLGRQIAALHIATQASDVPRWFADGFGWLAAKRDYAKAEGVKRLDDRATAAARQMQRLDDFANNRIDADQAALVGYLFVKQLQKAGPAYRGLLADLGKGKKFEASFADRFGMPVGQMLKRISDATKK